MSMVPALCQVNESWTLENCTVARCEGENHIVLLEPKPVANITCVNGHLPVKVWSENERCTYHLECECEQRGMWMGPEVHASGGTQSQQETLPGHPWRGTSRVCCHLCLSHHTTLSPCLFSLMRTRH